MKNLSRLLFAMLLVLGFSNTYAQDENNPWAISFGINAVDLYPVGEDAPQGDYFDEFFNAKDHWNVLPSLSTITVSKYLSNGFSLGLNGSINKIEKIGEVTGVPSVTVNDMTYYGLDGIIKYSFADLLNCKTIEPYLGVGGGYSWIDDIGAGTLNGSLGLNYWFTDNVGLNLQTSYKHSFEDYLSKHWQHSAGIAVKFGGKDTDGDGIYDKDDACPDVPG
ncbi:MAG: OmpA family protein, partial [Algibacter sp.]